MFKTYALRIVCIALLLFCPAILKTYAGSVQNQLTNDRIIGPSAVQIQPVLSGLTFTVFVTHAHDGTNRLFMLEKAGRIKVAQPGSSTATIFLDIVSRVLSLDNERGLLGLAFHPQYPINGRFFVYYTRQTDGAITLSEFHVNPNDPNTADPNSEIVLLNIDHSANNNHNGGMLAFGPDGFLYAGPGDGGSANDPPNNAQNTDVLLGKILRIDVDHPNGPIPYSSPPTNPFFGATPGADEIYAYGMRNPFRFSFDRQTGQLYVGDVGQNTREEIDIVTNGGNYGWRVMEGTICNPFFNGGVCTPPMGSILPIFDYAHTLGRCSITGGYIYRGFRSTVPGGAYVYADYCTGEIWQLLSGTNTLLLDTTLNITSFGEDESGEIFVVGQNGTINRLATTPTPPPCVYMVTPQTRLAPAAQSTTTLTISSSADCGWMAAANVSWITFGSLTSGAGTSSIQYTVQDNLTHSPRTGLIHVGGQTLTIVQDSSAAPNCAYTIRPAFESFPASGGSGSISVSAEIRCAWQATASDSSWITFTSSNVGTGNGVVNYSIGPNLTGKFRKGTITIANKVFIVKQKPS